MAFEAILNEVEQLHAVSERLAILAEQDPSVRGNEAPLCRAIAASRTPPWLLSG
jgi:hypothetical protein